MKPGRAMTLAPPAGSAMLAWLGVLVAVAAILAGATSAGADDLEIDPFGYASPEQAQASWVARAGSPPVQVADGGPWGQERLTVFPCDFSVSGRVRCFWDRNVSLDLSSLSVVALRLYCPDPTPLGWFTLYFRSGSGWYSSGAELTNAGWNLLRFQRDEFTTEGSPSGWDSIDRIRISPWRGQSADTFLYADRLWAYDPAVWVGGMRPRTCRRPPRGPPAICARGTTPGGSEISSAMAAAQTGYRRVASMGNASHGTSWVLEVPADPAPLCRSVQAVDAAFAGSAFAPGRTVNPVSVEEGVDSPGAFSLMAGAPDPFTGPTVLHSDVPRAVAVELRVYDVRGRLAQTLHAGRLLQAGRHQSVWSGRAADGQPAPPDVYFCERKGAGF